MITIKHKSGSLFSSNFVTTFWLFFCVFFLGSMVSCTSTKSAIFIPTITHTLPVETQEPTPHQIKTVFTMTETPFNELSSSQSTSNDIRLYAPSGGRQSFYSRNWPIPRSKPHRYKLTWYSFLGSSNSVDERQPLGRYFGARSSIRFLRKLTGLATNKNKAPNHKCWTAPLLSRKDDNPFLFIVPSTQASPLTHSIPIFSDSISQAYIDTQGDFILVDPNLHEMLSISVNALPDARILSDGQGRLLLLSEPTEKYDHGVLGDTLEASSITRIDDPLTGKVSAEISMSPDLVIEGISPIWADLNQNGEREIIVTVSNAQQGAQILVFNEDGQKIATGPDIGQGYRWRHQIAVAHFGPNDEIEIADVLTPHLGGVVEFYQLDGDQLKIVAQIPGYTSHVIGTRNLDMAAAGDFDGDGNVELVLPNQERSQLCAIRRTKNGAEEVWSLKLDDRIIHQPWCGNTARW